MGDLLYTFFGLKGIGPFYAFWSGAGQGLGCITLMSGPVIWLRMHNCHQPRCHRLGLHSHPEKPTVKLCRRHHPTRGHQG